MPITKGAKKAHRQSLRRKVVNDSKKEAMKQTIKDIREDIAKKSKDSLKEKLQKAFKLIDKSAKTGVIKKGNANRKKSRLAKAINKLG